MDFKNVLKLVGAGLTGGYLALKIRPPRSTYDEFLRTFELLRIEFLSRLKITFVETLLPRVRTESQKELEQLFDGEPNFLEKLRFFQRNVEDFDSLALRSMSRFRNIRIAASNMPAGQRSSQDFDSETVRLALDELFRELDQTLQEAMLVNLPEEEREGFLQACSDTPDVLDQMAYYKEHYSGLAAVIFDAFSRFEEHDASSESI